jgi:hypothetical protein
MDDRKMEGHTMKKLLPLALLSLGLLAHAQEGPLPTQTLVTVDSKDAPKLAASDLTFEVNKSKQPPNNLVSVTASGAQIALLIDDGLRESVGRELNNLRSFVTNLPSDTEIFIGYMSNGRVQQVSYFTTDHATAAAKIRLPVGLPGMSASPYFCLSEFVKHWPSEGFDGPSARKARFVIMLTNGVDPYNGSVSVMNQDSPYVQDAQRDAQRAGVSVSSIYFGDAGIRGGRASFSGQSYLAQIAEATGGRAYYEGTGNPVSTAPFFKEFQDSLAETYVATFPAAGKDLVNLRVKSNVPHVKVRAPLLVLPGNVESK